jgi:prevent-host-death family protein
MQTVGAYEAKTHLPKLLDRVSKGESITISRHGVPVATLQPLVSANGNSVKEAIAELRKIRKNCRLNGLSIREMMEEGRG